MLNITTIGMARRPPDTTLPGVGCGGFARFLKGRLAPLATSHMVGREDKRTNNRTMLPALKNNTTAGYKGPGK